VRLRLVPVTLACAQAFVRLHHRHHGEVVGHRFSVGVCDSDGGLRGVAIVGRPVARNLDDGGTCEVVRLCTDGAPNACSLLYSACWRAAQALGYTRIVTYILESEHGSSLRAANWQRFGETTGGEWSCPSRPRKPVLHSCRKVRWQMESPGGHRPPAARFSDGTMLVAPADNLFTLAEASA
jgi:hypothetical protein